MYHLLARLWNELLIEIDRMTKPPGCSLSPLSSHPVSYPRSSSVTRSRFRPVDTNWLHEILSVSLLKLSSSPMIGHGMHITSISPPWLSNLPRDHGTWLQGSFKASLYWIRHNVVRVMKAWWGTTYYPNHFPPSLSAYIYRFLDNGTEKLSYERETSAPTLWTVSMTTAAIDSDVYYRRISAFLD